MNEFDAYYYSHNPAYGFSNIEMAFGIFQIIIIIGLFISFFQLNKIFCNKHKEYKGKYLWTLLFFPLAYSLFGICTTLGFIAYEIGNLFTIEYYMYGWLLIIVEALLTFYVILNTKKLWNSLYNWKSENQKKCNSYINLIFGLGTLAQYLFFILYYLSILSKFSYWYNDLVEGQDINLMKGIIFWTIIDILIYYFAKRRIKLIPTEINEINEAQLNLSSPDTKNDNSGFEKLYDLKKLLDDGIISQNEFTQMKTEILSKSN